MKNASPEEKTEIAVGIFDKLAQQYQDKYMDVSMYHDSLDIFCEKVEKGEAEVLEVACGPGNITWHLLKKRPDFKLLGTDLAPNMVELAKNNNPGAKFLVFNAKEIKKLDRKFDAIMCGFCLPYFSKEESIHFIRDASGMLKPGGVLYLSTMEGDYSTSGWQGPSSGEGDQIYMHYHQEDYLREALEASHFKEIEVIRKVYPEDAENPTTDLIILAQK